MLYDERGFPKSLQGATRDITQRKQADAEITKYREHLEELVQERTLELQEAQEKLLRQERLAVLGQLAGSVGHELRNPLGVISNSVYFLKLIQPDADPQVQESLGMIENEIQNANRIITDLLDYARNKPAEREAISVSLILDDALNASLPPENVNSSVHVSEDLPPAYTNRSQMAQVLENLLTNAYQAMPEGGDLTIMSDLCGDEISIAVRDTGQGISPENLGKIFEPLFTTKTQGIGLGLALCKQLMERNEGRIEVQSELGKGSTFSLYMPLVAED
jgi:signal transduction histidine kinase